MRYAFKVLILQVVGMNIVLSAPFNFTCPEDVLRKLRSEVFCSDEKQYHCIYDTLKHAYVEKCIRARLIGEGKYSVLSGNLDVRECDQRFYSPYAVNPLWSNDGHRCYFMKSLCNEEGQVIASNGSSSTDRSCRCDYTRGYDYITTPKDPCRCSPATEDCSCYIRVCSKHEKLNQDYECTDTPKDAYRCNAIVNKGFEQMPDAAAGPSTEKTCNDCSKQLKFESIAPHVIGPILCVMTVLLIILVCFVSVLVAELLPCYHDQTEQVENNRQIYVRIYVRKSWQTVVSMKERKLDEGQSNNSPSPSSENFSIPNEDDTVPKTKDLLDIFSAIYHRSSDMGVVNYYQKTKQINELDIALKQGNHNKLIILRGMPGSGKTQAAHYYCQQEIHKYSIVAKLVATDSDSLFHTLKELTKSIRAEIVRDDGEQQITTPILCNSIKSFLNDKRRSTLKYIFLVDNARLQNVETQSTNQFIDRLHEDLQSVLLLVKEVENLDMILTTYDSTFKENYDSVEIQFDGMDETEYTKLLNREPFIFDAKTISYLKISDEDIVTLIGQIGNLPIIVNSARQYIYKTKKSVKQYLDTYKTINKFKTLDSFTNLFYKKQTFGHQGIALLESQQLPLEDVKRNVQRAHGTVLVDVLMLLPLFQYESISTTVLEACYFHLPNSKGGNKKGAIDTLLIECQRFSLCFVNSAEKSKIKSPGHNWGDLDMSQNNTIRNLTFHDVTMWTLDLSDVESKNKARNLEFLLKMFCFEIDIDARTDRTLQRNMLFLPHARKVLRKITESNIGKSDTLIFYISYLHCAIGSTYLFGKTELELAHIHLVKSRSFCLKIVGDKSYFTKAACIFQQRKRDIVKRPTFEIIKTVAESVFKKEFDKQFVQEFVLGMRRSLNDVEAIRSTAELELQLCNGHYLQEDEYNTLVENKYAIPTETLGKILLGELLQRILVNNGRVLNEFLYLISDKDRNRLQETCNTEFYTANEFCKLLKEQYSGYLLFSCLENDRTGKMLLRFSEKSLETKQIDNDIAFYKDMLDKPFGLFDRCFNFGVLKMSQNFNDRHICMCRRILIRFLHLKYEREDDGCEKSKIFQEGRREVEQLQEKLKQMETEHHHHTWLTLPLLHIQCAKFLLLSQDKTDTEHALKLFREATELDESRTEFWTRYKHEGYHGEHLCLHQLERMDEAGQLIQTISNKYYNNNIAINQIKNKDYKRW